MQETQEMRVWSLGQEDPLEKEMATHSSILAWKIPGQRMLAVCSPKGQKTSDMTKRLSTYVSDVSCWKQDFPGVSAVRVVMEGRLWKTPRTRLCHWQRSTLWWLACETSKKKIGKQTYFPNSSGEFLLLDNHIVWLLLMYLNMGRLGCSPPALYVLALEAEASQSTMITPTQTSFNTIKHFVIVHLITQASEHEPRVSA